MNKLTLLGVCVVLSGCSGIYTERYQKAEPVHRQNDSYKKSNFINLVHYMHKNKDSKTDEEMKRTMLAYVSGAGMRRECHNKQCVLVYKDKKIVIFPEYIVVNNQKFKDVLQASDYIYRG